MLNDSPPPEIPASLTLRTALSPGRLTQILPSNLRKALQGDNWKLGDREYRDQNAELLFQQLQAAGVKVLWLDLNKKSTIIKEISRPQYPNLTALYLGDNNINSLEPLASLQTPLLQKLYLNHNKVVCLRSLRRAHFPQLVELNFNGNFIVDEQPLWQCHFPKVEKLSISYPIKKEKIFQGYWFMRSQLSQNAIIRSSKSRLGAFTRKGFISMMGDAAKGEPKGLFKTLQK